MVSIDKLSRVPIYEQIVDGICKEVVSGLLAEGAQLPSVREMSQLLSANPNTIQKAYLELDRRGVIASAPGVGTFIKEGAVLAIRQNMKEHLTKLQALTHELATAGIPKDEVLAIIERAYASIPMEKENKL